MKRFLVEVERELPPEPHLPDLPPSRPSEVSSRLHPCLSWHLLATSWVLLVGCHQARHPHCALTSWGSYFCVMGLFSVLWSIWTLLQMCAFFVLCCLWSWGVEPRTLWILSKVSEWGYSQPFLFFILRHGFTKFPRLPLNFRSPPRVSQLAGIAGMC